MWSQRFKCVFTLLYSYIVIVVIIVVYSIVIYYKREKLDVAEPLKLHIFCEYTLFGRLVWGGQRGLNHEAVSQPRKQASAGARRDLRLRFVLWGPTDQRSSKQRKKGAEHTHTVTALYPWALSSDSWLLTTWAAYSFTNQRKCLFLLFFWSPPSQIYFIQHTWTPLEPEWLYYCTKMNCILITKN